MQSPLVSIIIPLYNHEKFIVDTLDSVINQSYKNIEILIVDDGSTDNSANLVHSIIDSRIKYYYQKNSGAHNALNYGIRLAGGVFISILNSDDVYHPQRIEKCVETCINEPNIDAVFSHILCINDQNEQIKPIHGAEINWIGHEPATSFKNTEDTFLNLLGGNFLCTTSNLFCKKAIFDEVGCFINLRYAHDYEFFLKIAFFKNVSVLPLLLLQYRIHSANTIKENQERASFEVGLVLSNILINYDLSKYFNTFGNDLFFIKLLHSVHFYQTERIALLFILSELKYKKYNNLLDIFGANPKHIISVESCKHIATRIENWQSAFTQLTKQQLEHENYLRQQLQNNNLKEMTLRKEIDEIRQSKSYRLSRLILFPVRIFRLLANLKKNI